MFTNGILPRRKSWCPPDSLRTGADSFKRVLRGQLPKVIDYPHDDYRKPDEHADPTNGQTPPGTLHPDQRTSRGKNKTPCSQTRKEGVERPEPEDPNDREEHSTREHTVKPLLVYHRVCRCHVHWVVWPPNGSRLKLRRRAKTFTNAILPQMTGAGSFRRTLGRRAASTQG